MSNVRTQWRIDVHANTKAARAELGKFVKTAQAANTSFENMFANVNDGQTAKTFKNVGHELDRMNTAVKRGKVQMSSWNRHWQNSNNLIRHSKQLQMAHMITVEKASGAMVSATAVMRNFGRVAVTTGERLAYMNTWFRAASQNAINAAKNIQWSGRQITVGFGVPFGMAMAGASMAFFQFEEQVVRFRKVFNDEINSLSIDDAVERVTTLANTMATQLGIARNEVMETAATFAQMGYSTPEIERLTRAATELAMLGEMEPADATDLLRAYSASGFFDRFEGDAEEFEDTIKNMLNAIENSTGLTIEMMADNMSQLIPLFNQFQFERGEGESILAGMTEALGGQAAEAATALKTIMNRVYTDSQQTKDNFEKIGINIDALQQKYKGDIRGLLTELGVLLETNDELRDSNLAAAETFGKLFGIRQVARGIAAIRSISTGYNDAGEAANDFGRALNVAQQDQENAAKASRELNEQAESVGGQFRRLKESVIIAATSIGEDFLEMVMPAVKGLRNLVEWFSRASEGFKRFSIGTGLVIVAVGGLLTTVGVLAQAFLAMARAVGFLLPKFNLWTEETFRNRTATSHLDQEMSELRQTVQGIVPIFESIEQAQRGLANATNRATAAVRRQQSAMRGQKNRGTGLPGYSVGKSRWGGPVRQTGDPLYYPNYDVGLKSRSSHGTVPEGTPYDPGLIGPQAPRRPTLSEAEQRVLRGKYRDSSGRWRDHLGRFTTNPNTGSIDAALGSISGGRQNRFGGMMAGAGNRIGRRNARLAAQGPSSIKWRRGAGSAGALLGLGGYFVGGETGSKMVGAGVGLEGLSLLANPKIMDGARELSEKLRKSAMSATGITKAFRTGQSALTSLLGSVGGLSVAMVAVGAAAYAIFKHMENSKKQASQMRNEFAYADDLANEFGMKLGDSIIQSGEGIPIDELEQTSDAIQSVVHDISNLGPEEDVQRVFRNLARQWRAGGATIDEINKNLDELEAEIGVEIDSVSMDSLTEQLELDATTALENAFGNVRLQETFAHSLFKGFAPLDFLNAPFGSNEGQAELENLVNTFSESISNAIRFEDADEVQETIESLNALRADQAEMIGAPGTTNRDLYDEEYKRMLEDSLGIPQTVRDSLEDVDEVMSYYYASILTDQNKLNMLTEEQIENLEAAAQTVEVYQGHSEDFFTAMSQVHGLGTGLKDELREAAYEVSGIAGNFNFMTLVETGDRELLKEYITEMQALADSGDYAGNELGMLVRIIENLEAALRSRGLQAQTDRLTALAERAGQVIDGDEPDPGDEGDEGGSKYADAFRSALDEERNNITSYIVDQFDEATDGIVEAAEDQRDARIEALEEAQEAEIEGLEDARDAELDALEQRKEAIDEYLDKQKEIEESMQQQVDLVTAIATGDRDEAAQIQNAMRFGTIEDMAESEKDRIDEQIDAVKDRYDDEIEATKELHEERMEQEKEYFENHIDNIKDSRKAQKKALEDNLDDLDSMFLGTQKDWNAFIAEAQRIAGQDLPPAMRNGFDTAMTAVVEAKTLDRLWEETDFSALSNEIENAIMQGVNAANDVLVGWYTGGGNLGPKQAIGFDKDLANALESFGTAWIERHRGGPIGGGAPRDVPAVLQTGEYVIQRRAAQALGRGRLEDLNNAHKYHEGGSVSSKNTGYGALGASIGRNVAANIPFGLLLGIQQRLAEGLGGFTPGISGGMPRSQWGSRTWAQIAPNTAAAQKWVKSTFDINFASAGTNRGDKLSDHSYGKATDIFPGKPQEYAAGDDLATGNAIARWFMDNTDAFGTKYVIWQGRIANPSIGGGKWRPYTRLKGITGGHYDHVHVSFLHGGGEAGSNMIPMSKGGRLTANNVPALLHRGETVLRAPVARSLEDGIRSIEGGGSNKTVNLNIGEFNGTKQNVDYLIRRVKDEFADDYRRTNPTRSIA